MKIYILVVLFCLSSLSQADSAYCNNAAKNNYPALRNIAFFTYDIYRNAKVETAYAREYYCIKDGNSPEKDFESLLEGSTIAGQLYGLLGLSESSPERYNELKRGYADNHAEVDVLYTEVVGYEKISSLALSFVNREKTRDEELGRRRHYVEYYRKLIATREKQVTEKRPGETEPERRQRIAEAFREFDMIRNELDRIEQQAADTPAD